MLNVGTPELLVILLVALLVLGPTKLPDAARKMGAAMTEARRLNARFQQEMRAGLHEADDDPRPGGGNGSRPAERPLDVENRNDSRELDAHERDGQSAT